MSTDANRTTSGAELAPRESQALSLSRAPLALTMYLPQTFDDAWRLARIIAASGMVSKHYTEKPEAVFLAMAYGHEIGLAPLQAVQNIAVIGNRPSLWGDALLAICQASPDCVAIEESDDGTTATCIARRRGRPDVVRTFSMEDARTASLTGKDGPWKQYPARMRQMRARGFALRDQFADVLRGMSVREEMEDIDDAPTIAEPRRIGQSSTVPSAASSPAPTPTVDAPPAAAAVATAPPPEVTGDLAVDGVSQEMTGKGDPIFVVDLSTGTLQARYYTRNTAIADTLRELVQTDHRVTVTSTVGRLKGQDVRVITEVAVDRVPGADDDETDGAR